MLLDSVEGGEWQEALSSALDSGIEGAELRRWGRRDRYVANV